MKLKRLLTLCCALSMALGMVTFVIIGSTKRDKE